MENKSMERKSAWYVYTLADPATRNIFYIGKGSRGRINQHEIDAANPKIAVSAKLKKIQQIWASGAQVAKSYVAYFWDEQAAYDHETDMIEEIGLCNLTNVMPGGQKAFDRRVRDLNDKRKAPDLYLSVDEFRRETIGQSPTFIGMYLNLMMASCDSGGQLPDDEVQLQRISRADLCQWSEHRKDLANLFVRENGSWSPNLVSKRRKAAGTKGNDSRWAANRDAKATTATLLAQIASDGAAY